MVEVRDHIALTPDERALFDTLLAAAKHAGNGTILRAAGGWVRDKLIGRDSPDIDIALDNMVGKEFAEKVNEYLAAQGQETHRPAVIQSNPEQSKHLETARMKVGACYIDLVNLRSETYADGSRIPKMEFGTPAQDALRRDFTINALFYNLNEGRVEDLTGRGLADLRAGLLRTPLPAKETFLDDPLRVMRAVRFATRFSFELDEAILEAASSDEVRQALGSKVSRERIGTELEGCFNGPAPSASVKLVERLRLFPVVFAPPRQLAPLLGDSFGHPCAAVMAAAEQLLGATDVQLAPEDRRLLLLAAVLLPLRGASIAGKGSRPQPSSAYIIRDSLKWRVREVEGVAALHDALPQLAGVQRQLGAAAGSGTELAASVPVALGGIIRRLKQHWQLGVLLLPLLALPEAAPLGLELPLVGSGGSSTGVAPAAQPPQAGTGAEARAAGLASWLDAYQELMAAVQAFGLEECWKWKPVLDGKQVMAAVGMTRSGPQLGQLLAAVMDWQLEHPSGDADECVQHIRGVYAGIQAAQGTGKA